nr:hypothetical protein B0A51_04637 [Rachicladosporium sp. CCFEE 5018]
MYRTTDPRFRRRIQDLTQTLESANESAQSNLYIFSQSYVRPCFSSIGGCFYTCVDASCPSLNLQNRDRFRRQRGRGRSRGRAELNFDFYDDWDGEEEEGLLGWGGDDIGGVGAGYGTVVEAQPVAKQTGMTYPRDRRRKSVHEGTAVEALPGGSFFSKLFGKSKAARYRPTAADLQEHPGARGKRDPEAEGLLEGDSSPSSRGAGVGHRRVRSATVASSTGSYSSRGDIFPSDDEDDAVPLDDEFAMVLERRNTGGVSGPETESSSGRTGSVRGKRKARGSSRRTMSERSEGGKSRRGRSRAGTTSTGTGSSLAQTPVVERTSEEMHFEAADTAPIVVPEPTQAAVGEEPVETATQEQSRKPDAHSSIETGEHEDEPAVPSPPGAQTNSTTAATPAMRSDEPTPHPPPNPPQPP